MRCARNNKPFSETSEAGDAAGLGDSTSTVQFPGKGFSDRKR